MGSRHSVLMNAFRPAREVDDPEFFAGRSSQVKRLTDALHMPGSCPLIYGDRGIGKTSLAVQMQRIAMGDVELLSTLGSTSRIFDEDSRYLTYFVTCTDATRNVAGLLQALINTVEETELNSGMEGERLADRTTRHKVTLKVVELETTKKYEAEKARLSYRDFSTHEKLQNLTRLLIGQYERPILFIIDELDRLRDTRGLASFIKATSSDTVKFMLVGISTSISNLLTDHRSLERNLTPVRLPLMNEGELYEIIENAERYLKEKGIRIEFDHFAALRIIKYSAGFPWFVHVIGQSALLLADEAGKSTIDELDVTHAVDTITRNEFAQQFSDMYQNAVRDSYQRELVLRTLAHWTDADIPTSEVYRVLKMQLGVRNPSIYKGQLMKAEYGNPISTPEFQKRGLVRFTNEMFKAYIRMRPSIYQGVDERVHSAIHDKN